MSLSGIVPPRRFSAPLTKLISAEELAQYAQSSISLVSFLDPSGTTIGVGDLCRQIAAASVGVQACAGCPIQLDGLSAAGDCVMHVRKAVEPIRANDEVIGYVKCQAPLGQFFAQDLSGLLDLTSQLKAQFEDRTPAKEGDLKLEARRIADRLARRCSYERILYVSREAIQRVCAAKSSTDVLDCAFSAIRELLGEVDLCFYAANLRAGISLIEAHGPMAGAAPRRLESGQGHVGQVILNRKSMLEKDLVRNRRGFIQVDEQVPAVISFTVPSQWGEDGEPAALQVTSPHQIELSPLVAGVIETLGRVCGAAIVALARSATRHSFTPTSSDWHRLLLELAIQQPSTAVKILDLKRTLYDALAENALTISGGFAASVRLFNPRIKQLRFIAWAGDWTDDLKDQADEETPSYSAGLRALEEGKPLYEPDVQK